MVQSRTGDPWEKNLDCQVSGHCYLEKAGLGIFSWLVYICQTLLPFCMKKTPNPFHWGPMHVSVMGESTSVYIRRCVKLKCAYGDLHILTISRMKRIKIFLFLFCSAIWSNPYTRPLADPCFLKLTRADALPEVVKIVVNWWDPCFIHLRSPEQFEKNAVFVRGLWAFRCHWQKCEKQIELEVDSGGGRGGCWKFDEPRVATKNYQLKNQWKGERNWARRWTSDPSSRSLV